MSKSRGAWQRQVGAGSASEFDDHLRRDQEAIRRGGARRGGPERPYRRKAYEDLRVKARWRELELEPIGLHESRHTFATWLDHAGVSPKVASQIMGHKTPEYQLGAARITLQRYTHVLPGELERDRDRLDAFLLERASEGPAARTLLGLPNRDRG